MLWTQPESVPLLGQVTKLNNQSLVTSNWVNHSSLRRGNWVQFNNCVHLDSTAFPSLNRSLLSHIPIETMPLTFWNISRQASKVDQAMDKERNFSWIDIHSKCHFARIEKRKPLLPKSKVVCLRQHWPRASPVSGVLSIWKSSKWDCRLHQRRQCPQIAFIHQFALSSIAHSIELINRLPPPPKKNFPSLKSLKTKDCHFPI